MSNTKKGQFQARLDSQKEQLERNGYSAEVIVRTTPEATDMINFARLWEHILVTSDRKTRGYMAASKRGDYEETQKAFLRSIDFMMEQMKAEVERHNIDLTGNNFVSRVAQRYGLSTAVKKAKKEAPEAKEKPAKAAKAEKAEKVEADVAEKATATPKVEAAPKASEQVEGL